jgi:hypothetical protein
MGLLKDIYGKIMIDESEARSDIESINSACELIENARRLFNADENIDRTRMEGEAASLLVGHLERIHRSLGREIDSCRKTADFIKSVVEKYIETDRVLSQQAKG